jgi:4-amino-4-deoxy-L-arabinose transferase-like glycosyltransferase
VSGALAALTRAELVLVLALLILAMAFWWRRGLGPARRWALGAVATAGALVTFAPWWAYTIPRFAEPVPLSTQSGVTLVSANCDSTYFGPRIGYWDFSCGQQLGVHLSAKDDASVQDVQLRRAALHYMAQHKSRVPVVMAARLGREFGVFEPLQQIDFEWQTLHRPRLPAYLGLGAFFAAGLLALSGARILRRRRISLIPFGTVLAVTVVVCLASFGQTRYRTSLDAAIVRLAAVSIVQLATLVSKRRQINTENPDPTMALPAGVPAGPPGHRSPNSALREREDG